VIFTCSWMVGQEPTRVEIACFHAAIQPMVPGEGVERLPTSGCNDPFHQGLRFRITPGDESREKTARAADESARCTP
jgi:hypothetical protein